MPVVSIIIAHYNKALLLKEAVRSVQGQSYADWELIIVDDHSDESERSSLNDHSVDERIRIIKREGTIRGASVCRNQGAAIASGKYIMFLDADDLLAPYCLVQRIEIMQADPATGWAVFSQFKLEAHAGDDTGLFSQAVQSRDEAIRKFLELDPPWQTMASFWRRDVFDSLGGFDESLLVMEDPDLHVRALLKEDIPVQICMDKKPDTYYRINELEAGASEAFYRNSILYRFEFIRRYAGLPAYHASIRKGYFNFLRHFLLHRLAAYKASFDEMNKLLFKENVLGRSDMIKLNLLRSVFLSNSTFTKMSRLKGLAWRTLR